MTSELLWMLVVVQSIMTVMAIVNSLRRQPMPITDERMLKVMDKLQLQVNTLEDKLAMWQAYAMQLAMQIVSMGGKPVSMDDIENAKAATINRLSGEPEKLVRTLTKLFSLDELELIAYELGAKEGALGVGAVDARALKLMRYAENNGRLRDLAGIVWRQRPDADLL